MAITLTPHSSNGRPAVALVAHWDWVLHHFRMPIARGLRDAGCEVVLVCPPGPLVPALQEAGFRWVAWPVNRRSVRPRKELAAVRSLARIYRRERFAAVHHFTVKPVIYGSLAARAARVPVVLNMFSGLGYLFSGAAGARRLRWLLAPIMRWAFGHGNVWMLALNDSDLAVLRQSRLAATQRSVLIPEGVDLTEFRPRAETPPPGETVIVLMACRLLADKGVAEFVAAARLLRHKGLPVRFQLAGTPDPGNPATVVPATLAQWQAEEVVELLGQREDMSDVIAKANIAVLPTHYMEGVPRFLIEAAACGLPLVATDIPGCRDVVHDGVNGYLVPTHDAEALATAIGRLAVDAELRSRFGLASRDMAETQFGEQQVVEAHLRLYRTVGVLPAGCSSGPRTP